MLKRQKERVVADLVERLRESDTLIVADYRGLSMPEIDGVRTEVLKHGARFTVVKNTLTKRAPCFRISVRTPSISGIERPR